MGEEVSAKLQSLHISAADMGYQEPQIFDLSDSQEASKLQALLESGKVLSVIDRIDNALDEIFDIHNPQLKDSKTSEQVQNFILSYTPSGKDMYGRWVYFEWSKTVVHFPTQEDFYKLRTSRNRNLVTTEEQTQLGKSTIVVVGMSVGSNVIEAMISQGIGGHYILVDMDTLDPTNLNRIRSRLQDVGEHKVDVIAKKVSEIDPFITQTHYKNGLNEHNLQEIIDTYKPDILIDEMDSVDMKLRLRYAAQKARIPVIMAADDGDNILLDVERYDEIENLPILHGKIPEAVIDRILSGQPIPRPELGLMIGRYFVGFENTPLRMFMSLGEVGKTLPSWPQLGGAAALAGITLAYCAKKIILGQPINAGRFVIGPDEQLDPEIKTAEYKAKIDMVISQLPS